MILALALGAIVRVQLGLETSKLALLDITIPTLVLQPMTNILQLVAPQLPQEPTHLVKPLVMLEKCAQLALPRLM